MTETNQPVIRSRRALPSGRAVLGALLITLAALGVLFATRLSDDSTFQNAVVATRDLGPGQVIEAADVATVRLRLDDQVEFVANDVNQVIGNVTLGPIAQFEFVQASNIASMVSNEVPGGLATVSLPVSPSNAPLSINPGELVSILVTFDDNDGRRTELVADRLLVISYGTDGDEFGTNTSVRRVAVGDGENGSEIALASATGEVSVVGITGANDVDIPQLVSSFGDQPGEPETP